MSANLRLGDHCLKIGSGATPRGGKEAYLAEGPYSLIRSQNVLNERFSAGGLAFISQEQADQLSNVEVQPGDVLLNITGDSVARVCQVDPAVLPARVNQHVAIIRPKPEVIDPRFLRYFLVSPEMQAHMLGLAASGATRNALTKGMIEKFEIPAVPLPEQRAIAATLGALDDKIELNRKMNATLEAMARVLFRDWFVDFGPTRAKMEGRAPYLSPDLWPLFPDRLDDEEKPEGWRSGTLGVVATARNEGVDPSAISPDTPYIGLEHMPRGSIALADWDGAGKVSSNKAAFTAGDFLFGKLRPYFHKVGVAPISGICSTDIVVVRPKTSEWAGFVIACISDDDFVAYTDKTSTGTKMPRTSWSIMAKYALALPPATLAAAFDATVAPMLSRIRANIHESHTLAQTRDLLLPKLMSGEVRVKDAEQLVGEAT